MTPAARRPPPPVVDDPDACWHCGAVLEPEPPAHCDRCPAFDECDDAACTEPGCLGELACPPGDSAATATYDDDEDRLETAMGLLRRVIYEPNNPARNVVLIQDIQRFVRASARAPRRHH